MPVYTGILQDLQLSLPSAALPGFLPHTGCATQCWSPWTTGGTKQQLTSLQKWLCAMTEKPVSRGSRNSKNGMKLEQINKLDRNLIGRLKLIAVGSDLSCDQFLVLQPLISYSKKLGNTEEVINYRVVNPVLSHRKPKIQFSVGISDFLILIELFPLGMLTTLKVGFSSFPD